MPQTVTLDELPAAIERIALAGLQELDRAGHVEAGTELGDRLASTQRYRTGRAAHSTTVTGRRPVAFDPGPSPNDQLAFYLPASRTELLQSAEDTIPKDPPGSKSHVIEAAGENPEGKPYPGFLERRFKAGEKAIKATESAEAKVAARADRRAERGLKRRGL